MTTEHSKGIQGAAWLNIVLGALILLTPFFTNQTDVGPLWSAVLAGAAVIILAGFNAYTATQRHTERAYGPAVVNVLLGLWVFVSPFVFVVSTAYMTSMLIYGVILVVAAGYNTWAASDARRHEHRMHV